MSFDRPEQECRGILRLHPVRPEISFMSTSNSAIHQVLVGKLAFHIEHADCLDVLRELPDGCIDAIVTDPPYGIGYRTTDGQTVRNDERPFIWWLHDAHRVLREGGALICFHRWDVQEAFRLAIEWSGFRVRSQVVWDKLRHGTGDCFSQFAPQHELMWFATKGRFRFPAKRPVSVLRSMKVPHQRATHPTQKPVELMRGLLEAVAPRGGLVLDPFSGSGSTGAAARELGLRYLGVEIEGRYVQVPRAKVA